MAIPLTEELVPLNLVPRSLPNRPHLSTVFRWISRGVDGVRLEALRCGGRTYTSHEALQRFCDRLTNCRIQSQLAVSLPDTERHRAAEEELERKGIPAARERCSFRACPES